MVMILIYGNIHLFRSLASNSDVHALPNALDYADDQEDIRDIVHRNTEEYSIIITEFDKTMADNYRKITRIERVQNERWHKQYLVHRDDFQKRLQMNTEKFLYHGCSETAADSIIDEYFNRSFAGKNGECSSSFI